MKILRLQNLANENEKIETVQDENTEMFYVKIKPQLENNPVQGFGGRAVLGLFHIKYCVSHFYGKSFTYQNKSHTFIPNHLWALNYFET